MKITFQPNAPGATQSIAAAGDAQGGSFANLISAAISQVESTQASADQIASDLLAGGRGDIHSVALASQKAELSMEMFQQIRNKFVQAYQEVMKMPM